VMCGMLAIQLTSILSVYVTPITYLKSLFALYIHFFTVAIFISAIELGAVNVTTPFLWFFVVALAVFILYPWKKVVYWLGYFFVLVIVAGCLSFLSAEKMVVANLLQPDEIKLYPLGHTFLSFITLLVFVFLIFCFFLYYLHKFQEIKLQALLNESAAKEQKDISFAAEEAQEDFKYRELYGRIEAYFDSAQPFVNPDFSIFQLASAVNSNITYVSKAIKLNRDINFNVFVNHYRIEKVKEMLQNKSARYTLEHIASACGFNSQSTFNKAFKLIEGITPSDYCKKHRQTSLPA
jgi:AraC-like DNA-binding protein